MNYVGVFAIDSWHLANGIHCPSVDVSLIFDNLDEVLDWSMDRVDTYRLKLEDGTPITREMLKEKIESAKYLSTRIHFEYPREGEITIRFTD